MVKRNRNSISSSLHLMTFFPFQQLLNILYVKGPETTGIFRRVANTRSVKDCVEKIERNQPLNDDELHPILAACLFKVNRIELI